MSILEKINFLYLILGLSFFLYGMTVMSNGLKKMSGSKLETNLKKMTSNPFKSLALGAGITIAIQSSSAMTVMLVGLVNSGIMSLEQTVGVIFGSNIGTTLTTWIMSLSGLEGGNFFLDMLKPANFSPVIALIGVILIMVAKSEKKKDLGSILVGFAILMYGMEFMGNSMDALKGDPEFAKMMLVFNNPILGVLVGAVVTGIIQSSAASVGILLSLAGTNAITYGMALPIILGQNIGTCVTALISSIGVNRNARKVAVVHMSFNVIGTFLVLALYYGLDSFIHFSFTNSTIDQWGISLIHTTFNVFSTIILLPFSNLLVKIANLVVKDKDEEEKTVFIDERLLNTPAVALSECDSKAIEMAQITKNCLLNAFGVVRKAENGTGYDKKRAAAVLADEKAVDKYEDKLGSFLVKVSGKELSQRDSREVSKLLHTIGDFERMSDHAVNLLDIAQEIKDKQIQFSEEAKKELKILVTALEEIISHTVTAFAENNLDLARDVEPLEQVVDRLTDQIRANHINRLQKGDCTIELGFVLSDLLNNFERISDHCSNVAVAMIEVAHDSFATHKYLGKVKSGGNADFSERFGEYERKYRIN